MALSARMRKAFERQASTCRRLGSPFTATLLRAAGEALDASTETGRRLDGWPGDPDADAVALRLAGGLHWLVRAGRVPALAAAYPPREPDAHALAALVPGVVAAEDAFLSEWLDHPPQTNEVARSGVLIGGLALVAARTGCALSLDEIGASAGLNLLLDRWSYDLGAAGRWGPANAPIQIACDWRGRPPERPRPFCVAERAGCDLAPLDPGRAEDRARMLAYIWPDQPGRLARSEAALSHAAEHGVRVAREPASVWAARRLSRPPSPGIARVLMHSIMWSYLPTAEAEGVARAAVAAGAEASEEAPVFWLRYEQDGDPETAAVELTSWPGGRTEVLGRADFHGRFAVWNGV